MPGGLIMICKSAIAAAGAMVLAGANRTHATVPLGVAVGIRQMPG
jgi:hypothetical protein